MLIWTGSCTHRKQRSLFLDRDGVINRDRPDYIKHWREFDFYPDSLQALREMKQKGVNAILISNQSALNRGLISWPDFWDLHHRMARRIAEEGGDLAAALYCPHRPDEHCTCRKPSPGMLHVAMSLFQIPAESTFMIGDRPTDLMTAHLAGCRSALLQRENVPEPDSTPLPGSAAVKCYTNLLEAVRDLFGQAPHPL